MPPVISLRVPTPTFCRVGGDNAYGQVGKGSGPDASIPADVALGEVVQVAAGSDHTRARQRSGTLRCWGRNDYGQVAPTSGNVFKPALVSVPDVLDVAVGDHTCCAGHRARSGAGDAMITGNSVFPNPSHSDSRWRCRGSPTPYR